MSRYLLPCQCGQKTPVSTVDAGTEVLCSCGQRLKVPSIRGLRELAEETSSADELSRPQSQTPAAWSLSGLVFVLGLFALLIGGGIAGWNGFVWSQVDTRDDHREQLQFIQSHIDQLTPVQLFETWKYVTKHGLGEYETPEYIRRRAISNAARLWFGGGVTAVIGGLAAMTYALVTGKAVRRKT